MTRIASLPSYAAKNAFVKVRNRNGFGLPRIFKLWNISERYIDTAPFFKITDDGGTASSFLDALADFKLDTARGLISKGFADSIDVCELAQVLDGGATYKLFVCAEFAKCPKSCKVKSVLFQSQSGGNSAPDAIVSLRMMREPDSASSWKIYSVERESLT